MISLSLNRLKLIAENRGIKDYENKSEELIKILSEPEPKISIESIRRKFNESRDRFSKSKTREIRRNLYEKGNKNILSIPEIKVTEKNLLELEKNISKLKKYYNYNDIEYGRVQDVKTLFDLSADEDHHKPIIPKDR